VVDWQLAEKHAQPKSISSNERRVYETAVDLNIALVERLRHRGEFTDERRAAISDATYIAGRHLVREGSVDRARRAFELSRELSPRRGGAVTPPMRILSGLVGPILAERLRSALVALRP
jgi:hypothetical protein